MKKKILFATKNLMVGGVPKVLVNLVNNIDYDKYDVTILLQDMEGDLIKDVKAKVHIEGYNRSSIKFAPLRKIINFIKMGKVLLKHYHKYDFAACFGTGYPPSSVMALFASRNNAIWMHTNIIKNIESTSWYQKNNWDTITRCKKYLKRMHFRRFKHNIFVSFDALEAYLSIYPNDKNKGIVCRNYVDGEEILLKSKEKVDDLFKKDVPTLINVSRHSEHDKRLKRIINACDKLKIDGYKFQVILVGDGEHHNEYVKMVHEKHLNDIIKFYGLKANPYPYMKNADAFILSSYFEGFPTTYTESLTLSVPVITTDVSDARSFIEGQYGIVVENNDKAIYDGIKEFLDHGYKMKKFDYKKYNKELLNKIYDLVNEK